MPRPAPSPSLPRPRAPRFEVLLAALSLAAVAARLWRAWHADWYWDEGYVAQLAQDLGRFRRPRAGALWYNGLLPLTAPWLAPLSAAPFTRLPFLDALSAVRVWAALLGGASTALLGLAGRRLGGSFLGLSSAALFALAPFPVALGGMALYHHLGCAVALACLWTALPPEPEGGRAFPDWVSWLFAGLAPACCYWLWWVPAALCFRPDSRGRRRLPAPRDLALGCLPLALTLALELGLGGPDARGMARSLAGYNFLSHYLSDLSHFPSLWPVPWKRAVGPLLSQAWAFLRRSPEAWVGLAGLFCLRARRRWIALAAALGLADLLRQRGGDLRGSSYALVPLLPWFCLGLAALAGRAAGFWPRGRWPALALAAALLVPCHMGWIRLYSVSPPLARNLRNYLGAQRLGDGTVVCPPNVGWLLRGVCRPVEYSQAAAGRGWAGGVLPAGLSPRAFAYDPRLESARFLVTCEEFYVVDWAPHVAVEGLAAEAEGWPEVFANPGFRVYANPRFGAKPDPNARILNDPKLYRQAAQDALELGRKDWAALAQRRGRE